ncbi:MAG TPA: helix-turn-helix transcriptional regulator [Bacteroides mediterraneensis]|uniref:AraC family transcriptional regulator n=1 Tax=Bacteroides mediterraneensis TaxID=1841856 RepID=UPI00262AF696|nr:helix-turn-helix domain-containing protein [Bacteroides mediterraneensis]HJH63485.1 helix-turn-helix transcriptional regulator [Bacteroides mediterraneensis]
MKREVFTQYDLDSVSQMQFEMTELSRLFAENGSHPYEAHIHSFYQIIWFRKGTGVHYVDFKEYPVADNTMFFISPGQIHYFETGRQVEGVVIHFNESFLSDEGSSENVFLKYNVFNAFDASPYYLIRRENAGKLALLVNEMEEEIRNEGLFAHSDLLKYLIKMLLIYVQRTGERGHGLPLCINNAANRTFVRFRQSLEHHYRSMHTVKEYAAHLNVSTKTLTNCVYESSHSTPLALINDRIVLEAKRQLLHSSLKVKEIAFQLGFEDPSYFIKFFKRYVGCLPAEFREQ